MAFWLSGLHLTDVEQSTIAMATQGQLHQRCRQRDGGSYSLLKILTTVALLSQLMVSTTQGRPVGRTLSQVNESALPPLAAGPDQPCPVVDCQEADQSLACPRESRIPSTFVINGNTCNGCMKCPPPPPPPPLATTTSRSPQQRVANNL